MAIKMVYRLLFPQWVPTVVGGEISCFKISISLYKNLQGFLGLERKNAPALSSAQLEALLEGRENLQIPLWEHVKTEGEKYINRHPKKTEEKNLTYTTNLLPTVLECWSELNSNRLRKQCPRNETGCSLSTYLLSKLSRIMKQGWGALAVQVWGSESTSLGSM